MSTLLMWPFTLQADQAQYFYDELGRLVGVVDGSGSAAVYNYDEVGNLLSIQRFGSSGGNVGIFLVAPGSSVVQKNVEIRGFGFTSPPSSNQVSFNGTTATVVSGTSMSLVVTVPSGASTGLVTVINGNGTATSPSAFTVLVPPIITGVDPPKVPQGGSLQLRIGGFNLKTASSVGFSQSGLTATIVSGATETTLPITITVAPTVPTGLYTFSVATPAGTAQSGNVKVEVRPMAPSFTTTKTVTVRMPVNTTVPATSAPTGVSFSESPVTSVRMPVNTTVPATSAPTGSTESVSAPTSVSMP